MVEKLGCHLPDRATTFQHWIIFNAREQKFKIVYGIQLHALRQLISVDRNNSSDPAEETDEEEEETTTTESEEDEGKPIDLYLKKLKNLRKSVQNILIEK